MIHCCSNAYKNLENVDLSKLPAYQRHERDCGSSEVQVARLTARISQISSHLAQNRKDYAARRGLEAILSQRKSLLQYVFKSDRCERAGGRKTSSQSGKGGGEGGRRHGPCMPALAHIGGA